MAPAQLEKLPQDGVGGVIRSAAYQYGNDLDKVTKSVEAWFDSYMERVSGWYKRRNQWILLGVGVLVAVIANVNVIGISRTLMTDEALRTQLSDQAVAAKGCDAGDDTCITAAVRSLPSAKLGLFWTETCPGGKCTNVGNLLEQRGIHNVQSGLAWLAGVAIGGLAISLGAPFWFDLIGRGKALKGAGTTPNISQAQVPAVGHWPRRSRGPRTQIPRRFLADPIQVGLRRCHDLVAPCCGGQPAAPAAPELNGGQSPSSPVPSSPVHSWRGRPSWLGPSWWGRPSWSQPSWPASQRPPCP